jgi:hypothetical protein
MILRGIIHGLLLIVALAATYFTLIGVFRICSSDALDALGFICLLSIGAFGYFYKRENGQTLNFIDKEAKRSYFGYSFGLALPFVSLGFVGIVPELVELGPWWPLFLLFLVPFGLAAQTINLAFLMAFGGWFYKK